MWWFQVVGDCRRREGSGGSLCVQPMPPCWFRRGVHKPWEGVDGCLPLALLPTAAIKGLHSGFLLLVSAVAIRARKQSNSLELVHRHQ